MYIVETQSEGFKRFFYGVFNTEEDAKKFCRTKLKGYQCFISRLIEYKTA